MPFLVGYRCVIVWDSCTVRFVLIMSVVICFFPGSHFWQKNRLWNSLGSYHKELSYNLQVEWYCHDSLREYCIKFCFSLKFCWNEIILLVIKLLRNWLVLQKSSAVTIRGFVLILIHHSVFLCKNVNSFIKCLYCRDSNIQIFSS